METCFGPFRLSCVDGIKKLKAESIIFGVADSLERDVVFSKLNLFFSDIAESDLNKDSIFSLCPLDNRLPALLKEYMVMAVYAVKLNNN